MAPESSEICVLVTLTLKVIFFLWYTVVSVNACDFPKVLCPHSNFSGAKKTLAMHLGALGWSAIQLREEVLHETRRTDIVRWLTLKAACVCWICCHKQALLRSFLSDQSQSSGQTETPTTWWTPCRSVFTRSRLFSAKIPGRTSDDTSSTSLNCSIFWWPWPLT